MKIAFVRPHLIDARSSDAMEPLVFAILAALTPPDVELVFFDERLEPLPEHLDADLVALTVGTYAARRAYQIAAHWRGYGIPIVMGGYHPSFLPQEALTYADAVVIGDAEGVWEQVILTEGCFRARRQCDRYSSILRRALGSRANRRNLYQLGAFLASNLISRKEILGKQGHRLGSETPLTPIAEGS
jgi:radical SAM superfamily enzyme YgiQ (UPF0313 family)